MYVLDYGTWLNTVCTATLNLHSACAIINVTKVNCSTEGAVEGTFMHVCILHVKEIGPWEKPNVGTVDSNGLYCAVAIFFNFMSQLLSSSSSVALLAIMKLVPSLALALALSNDLANWWGKG